MLENKTLLITGAEGFIGKNLVAELKNRGYNNLLLCGKETSRAELKSYTADCDFVFHLAGVNRPKYSEEFMEGNFGFTADVLESLEENANNCPILLTSSIQALQDNPYGKSKKAGEDLVLSYGDRVGARVFVYRLSNVFGKWCKPNYNSAVATFCHNIANDLPIEVRDRNYSLNLNYVDDVVKAFISAMEGECSPAKDGLYYVMTVHSVSLGEITDLLYFFHKARKKRETDMPAPERKQESGNNFLQIPDLGDSFVKKLYSTYLTYLPEDKFAYDLEMNVSPRGSFTECFKSPDRGQVSVNISKPGITKGNHWHHTKTEKFLVVSGSGVIRFRKVVPHSKDENSGEIIQYSVSGEKLEVVDIPPGYTHNITNIGTDDMVTVMWASELFDPENQDTYHLEV